MPTTLDVSLCYVGNMICQWLVLYVVVVVNGHVYLAIH